VWGAWGGAQRILAEALRGITRRSTESAVTHRPAAYHAGPARLHANGRYVRCFRQDQQGKRTKEQSHHHSKGRPDHYSGLNELKMYDLNGNMTADLSGTSSATRIAP